MKKKRKVTITILCLLALLTLVTLIPMFTTFYRRPRNMIRSHILRITPLGASIEDVIDIVESREDWYVRHISFERGFQLEAPGFPVIGEMSVRVHLGTYRTWHKWFPLMEWDVDIFWGFDMNGRLIEVHIRKLGMS